MSFCKSAIAFLFVSIIWNTDGSDGIVLRAKSRELGMKNETIPKEIGKEEAEIGKEEAAGETRKDRGAPQDADYLVIPNVFQFCEGDSILGVFRGNHSLEAAMRTCSKSSDCEYISYEYDSPGGGSQTWFCSVRPRATTLQAASVMPTITTTPREGWVVAVRPEIVKAPNYDIYINSQTLCEGPEVVDILRGASLADAAKGCDADASCGYFTMDFSFHSELPPPMPNKPIAYLCRGPPKSRSALDGWVMGIRKSLTANVHGSRRVPPPGKDWGGFAKKGGAGEDGAAARGGEMEGPGPITQSDHLPGFPEGSVVPAVGPLYEHWLQATKQHREDQLEDAFNTIFT